MLISNIVSKQNIKNLQKASHKNKLEKKCQQIRFYTFHLLYKTQKRTTEHAQTNGQKI